MTSDNMGLDGRPINGQSRNWWLEKVAALVPRPHLGRATFMALACR
jgi:hypothetical protein